MDWNSDGQPDIVSGERHGYFNVYIRRDTAMAGFRHYRLVDSTELDVGMSSEPAVVDWNGDGRKDLLLGEEAGSIRFYPNLTSDTWPGFQDFTLVEAAGQPINLFRVSPYVFDLDSDSTQDLVCGLADGPVLFFDNTGTNGRPELAEPETVRTLEGKPAEPTPPAMGASRCGFGDWNNDGVPDFLIGCGAGTVEVFFGALSTGLTQPARAAEAQVQVLPRLGGPPFGVTVARTTHVVLTDVLGRPVRNLGQVLAGRGAVWDGLSASGQAVNAGVYFCLAGTSSQRIVLVR